MRRGSVWQLDGLPAIPTQNLPRDKWLEYRRSGIGGSDIAGVMGISPWSTPLAVYCDKVGLRPPQDPSVAMEFGTRMEPTLRKWAEDEINKTLPSAHYLSCGGYRVLSSPYLYRHPEQEIFIGDPDGVVLTAEEPEREEEVNGGLELKTVDRFAAKEWADNMLPVYYEAQVQWYMGVTGLDRWIVGALIGKRFEVRLVPRNQERINDLQQAALGFWNTYVVPRRMPEATGGDSDLLLDLYPDATEDILQHPDMESLLEKYVQLGEQAKTLSNQKDGIKALVEQRIGDNKGLQAGRYKATWSRYTTSRVDSQALKARYPDVYRAVSKESPSGRLNVKEG